MSRAAWRRIINIGPFDVFDSSFYQNAQKLSRNIFEISSSVKRLKGIKRKVFNFKRANWENLNAELSTIDWRSYIIYPEPDIAWARFKSVFLSICEKHIPKCTIKSEFQPPWFDGELDKLCKKKDRLNKKFQKPKILNIKQQLGPVKKNLKF